MGQQFIKVSAMADALRNTGYKSIESAMSEIIDNSVQWDSKNIFIIMTETTNNKLGKKEINEIAFLDNGCGMNLETLSKCLVYGETLNNDRKGMGRFGVGLPQSSMYACPLVEVYSWQNGYNGEVGAHKVFLNMNAIKREESVEIEDPVKSEIPEKYRKYLEYKMPLNDEIKKYNFLEHGTLVIWKNCDRVNPKTITALFKRLDKELGRRFRYFINDGSVEIKLIDYSNPDQTRNIVPNDPLFLMENNMVLGNPENPGEIVSVFDDRSNAEPIFEPYGNEYNPDGIVREKIKYRAIDSEEIKEGVVTIKFSKVKSKFYDQTAFSKSKNPGNYHIGKHAKTLEGISIVRAKREIDFGQFDFYENTNEPVHRWWGCEISFEPELDEAFGVANNKQHVELKREDYDAYEDDEVKPVWLQIQDIVSGTIESMRKKNEELRKGARSIKDEEKDSTEYTNKVEEEYENDGEESETTRIKNSMSEEDRREKIKEELEREGIEKTTENIEDFMGLRVRILYRAQGGYGAPLFTHKNDLGICIITINTDHIFYKTYLESIFENVETKIAFEFFITAFVKAEDVTNSTQVEQNDKLISAWNERLRKYVEKQQRYGE